MACLLAHYRCKHVSELFTAPCSCEWINPVVHRDVQQAERRTTTKLHTRWGYLDPIDNVPDTTQRRKKALWTQAMTTNLFLFSPEPPKHATPTRNRIGGATQQEPDALLYRMAHGAHRRRVQHVLARLRERVRV